MKKKKKKKKTGHSTLAVKVFSPSSNLDRIQAVKLKPTNLMLFLSNEQNYFVLHLKTIITHVGRLILKLHFTRSKAGKLTVLMQKNNFN